MSRAGRDYHSLIARAVEGLHGSTRDYRLALYQRARTAQLNSFDPEISEAEFRRERNALEQAIRQVETKATAADDEQAKKDSKIVSDYATFLEETTTRPDCFYDASALPHPKETIIAAIEREIVRSTFEEDVDWLRSSGAFMWNFLEGIGPYPLPFPGVDTSQPPRSGSEYPLDQLRRIIASPEFQRDVERSANFLPIAEEENKEVEARVAVAIGIRRAMRGD
jgi:DNA-directed RNA polymerase subunit K/omega